jgi:hypothetical protein
MELFDLIKTEGDFDEWWDPTGTLLCHISRNSQGSWCGYVTIPKCFSIDYKDDYLDLSCHGGITYQSPNDDGDMVIGFDCAHSGDLTPFLKFTFDIDGGVYRDRAYVTNEVNFLADQVLNLPTVKKQFERDSLLDNILDSQ